jgi:hypothetical protein
LFLLFWRRVAVVGRDGCLSFVRAFVALHRTHTRARTHRHSFQRAFSRSLLSCPCPSLRQVQPRSFCADCKSNSVKHRCRICQVLSNKSGMLADL